MSNNRQARIRDFLRQGSAIAVKCEDESIPRLVRREPREHSLASRLDALDSLTRMRGGIGRPTRKSVKLLLVEIRAFAQDDQELLNRADEIESRLKSVKIRREAHQELTEAEIQKLRETAKPPFDVAGNDEVFWERDVTARRIEWFLSIPANIKFHITRRKSDGPREISTTTAI